jgi:hypothetical protein
MIALLERLLCQPFPALYPVNDFRRLHRYVQITTLDSKFKPRIRILDEMQRNLSNCR